MVVMWVYNIIKDEFLKWKEAKDNGDMLNEFAVWSLDKLRGVPWEEVAHAKSPPPYERWEAA